MPNKIRELRGIIYTNFDSEADMAKKIGWTRQRLSKITNGKKEPDIEELNVLARTLGKSVEEIAQIFLRYKSPNRQHQESTEKQPA